MYAQTVQCFVDAELPESVSLRTISLLLSGQLNTSGLGLNLPWQRSSKDVLQYTWTNHLAAILSAKGEINPLKTWDVNMDCLFNVLEAARTHKIKKVFFPSTIAVFGSNTPRVNTPQDTIRTPETVYGMSKVAGENWSSYYHKRYGVDNRSLRYPGASSGHE